LDFKGLAGLATEKLPNFQRGLSLRIKAQPVSLSELTKDLPREKNREKLLANTG